MKRMIAMITVLTIGIATSLWAHSDEHHDKKGVKAVPPKTATEAWTVIQHEMKEIGEVIAAKKITEAIHEAVEKILEAAKVLKSSNPVSDSDKKKRFESALNQFTKQADKVHDTADETKNVDKTQVEYKKLQGAIKLVEAQLPDSFKHTQK